MVEKRKRWPALLGVAIVLALFLFFLGGTASRWWPRLWEFTGKNSASIEGLTGLVQLVLWGISFLIFLAILLSGRWPGKTETQSEHSDPQNQGGAQGRGIVVQGDRNLVATEGSQVVQGDVNGDVFQAQRDIHFHPAADQFASGSLRIIDQLWRLVSQAVHSAESMTSLVQPQDKQVVKRILDRSREANEILCRYTDENEIHFDEDLLRKLNGIQRKLEHAWSEFHLSQVYDHTKDAEAALRMHRGFKTVTQSIPKLKEDLVKDLRHRLSQDDGTPSAMAKESTPDVQVEFSYKVIQVSSYEHLYGLGVIVENQGPRTIQAFKIEFAFPDLDSIPFVWEGVGFLGPGPVSEFSDPSRPLVEIEPGDDAVAVSREYYAVRVTYLSRNPLFPDDRIVLDKTIGLKYRVNAQVYANLDDLPPLTWFLYADDMPQRKQGEISLRELNSY